MPSARREEPVFDANEDAVDVRLCVLTGVSDTAVEA